MPRGERGDSVAVSDRGYSGGPEFGGLLADLTVAVGQLRERMAEPGPQKPRIPWPACHPVWFTGQIPLTAGAGTLLNVNLYGPELNYWWDLRYVSVWGFTAGTVTIYRNGLAGSTLGEQLGQTTGVPGQFTWSAQTLLSPQDNLVFGATGINAGGVVNVTGQAIEVETAWLPEYLM